MADAQFVLGADHAFRSHAPDFGGLELDGLAGVAVGAGYTLLKYRALGDLAVFLCSENAGFITGTDILIDGGWTTQ